MYDIAIIGAGVVGSAIARELSKYDARICVFEKEEDVCSGTSKANSAIIHAGFDAKPGSLKAKLNVQGNAMMTRLSEELEIPFRRNGSLVVATKEQGVDRLNDLLQKGLLNGVSGLQIVEGKELRQMEPNLSEDISYALYAPTGGIACPFHMTIAFAENACENGVEFFLDTKVEEIKKCESGYMLRTHSMKTGEEEIYEAKVVINAAGVYADELHNMVSVDKRKIIPRKGEYCLLDKDTGGHVSHTIFQLPSAMGKGVLVTPTVHGNLLIGPTAEDVPAKDSVNTSAKGLKSLAETAGLSVKDLPLNQVITSFAGLRAHDTEDDFVIEEVRDAKGFIDVLGMESPGLSAAPAVGVMVASMAKDILALQEKKDFIARRKGILNPATLSFSERNQLISKEPAYGNIVCRCEMITEGEILDAIHRPLGARSLDGVKRRTRAGMGRCQSGFCAPKVMEILKRELELHMYEITKSGASSNLIVGKNKDL